MSSPFDITPLPLHCFWGKFDPPTIHFCEENLCSVITQPSNSWSNLGFIIAGIYLLRKGKDSISAGWIAILIGATSFLYHASFTFLMQFFDLSSMYLYSSYLITMNLERHGWISRSARGIYISIIVASSMLILFFFRKTGIPLFSIQVFIAAFLEFKLSVKPGNPHDYRNYKTALLLFLIAFVIWWLDVSRIFCSPENHFLQGHAIWHLLSAVSIIFLDKHYSPEKQIISFPE